jgi:hypothetical protein
MCGTGELIMIFLACCQLSATSVKEKNLKC